MTAPVAILVVVTASLLALLVTTSMFRVPYWLSMSILSLLACTLVAGTLLIASTS